MANYARQNENENKRTIFMLMLGLILNGFIKTSMNKIAQKIIFSVIKIEALCKRRRHSFTKIFID